MASTSWPGALRFGQWPVASSRTNSLSSRCACTYSPTSRGAMTSSRHWTTSAGVGHPGEVRAVVGEEGVRAKCRAIAGSVRQKLFASSWPSSGRCGTPMITGAMCCDQPR